MRARTGLWEPWVGNDPGPPGPARGTDSPPDILARYVPELRLVPDDRRSTPVPGEPTADPTTVPVDHAPKLSLVS